MKVLQINTVVNKGSVGRHTENVGKILMANEHESFIAYGRGNQKSSSITIKVGNKLDQARHLLSTRIFDKHGLASRKATKYLVKSIKSINPDLIQLRNIHGYYLNYEILFNYLIRYNIPVVWTFHDNWPFTGHCSFFDKVQCYRWQSACYSCPNKHGYPSSYLFDRSEKNFLLKKKLFSSLKNLTIITPSDWLTNHIKNSFLKGFPAKTIRNGIDISVFKPQNSNETLQKFDAVNHKIILGIANVWDKRKGLDDFLALSDMAVEDCKFILIGLSNKQSKNLPGNIIPVNYTNSIEELATFYSAAHVFVNPTYVDNFPTTNIESLACGTPVITYDTGGSPEAIDEQTGVVVKKGDIKGLAEAINIIVKKGKKHYTPLCRTRAEKYFNKDDRYMDYLNLYEKILTES